MGCWKRQWRFLVTFALLSIALFTTRRRDVSKVSSELTAATAMRSNRKWSGFLAGRRNAKSKADVDPGQQLPVFVPQDAPEDEDGFVRKHCPVFHAALTRYAFWRRSKLKTFSNFGNPNATTQPPSAVVYGRLGGGIGDRFPSIVSVFAFALRYERAFFVEYPALQEWLHSPFLGDMFVTETTPHLSTLYKSVRETWPNVLYSCDNRCIWAAEKPEERFPATEPMYHLVTNRGIWSPASIHPHMDFFTNMTRGPNGDKDAGHAACFYHALFKPTPALLALAGPYLAEFARLRAAGMRIVGVHYRSGDASLTRSKDKQPAITFDTFDHQYRVTVNACLRRNGTRVFFLSDSMSLKEDLKGRFGDSVITTAIQPKHVGHEEVAGTKTNETEALRDTLLEWWLLSRTDMIVLTPFSGFSRTAVAASNHGAYTLAGDSRCQPYASGHQKASWAALFKGSGL